MKLTEKQKNCNYCHRKNGDIKLFQRTTNYEIGIDHYADGWRLHYCNYRHGQEIVKSVFCYYPMCGRSLVEEED